MRFWDPEQFLDGLIDSEESGTSILMNYWLIVVIFRGK
jgi:hypothetical protein